MRTLFFLAAGLAVLIVACGDDDGNFDIAYETFSQGEIAYITGIEDGDLKYPRIEIWDQPACNYDSVLGNAHHGTEVRVIRKKTGCLHVQYEVELLEGDQAGMVGWLRAEFVHFGDEPPPGDLSD